MTDPAQSVLIATDSSAGLVSVILGTQTFGVPVLCVQDVIAQTPINRVPLAPPEVAGSLNLRGRIVTAIDLRCRLGMAPRGPNENFMSVIVEQSSELYAFLVDDVGDVLWLSPADHEPNPVTMPPQWRAVCSGLYRLEDELLLVINVEQILNLGTVSHVAA